MLYDPVADLGSLIKRRFGTLLVACLVAGILAVGFTRAFIPREYMATSRLLFEATSGSTGAFGAIAVKMGISAGSQANLGSLLSQILTSRTFAMKMIQQFQLAGRWREKKQLKAVSTFREHLTVESPPGGVLVIKFWLKGSPSGLISHGEDEETAQLVSNVVNAMITELQEYRRQTTYEASKRQRMHVEERLQEVEDKLQEALDRLSAFQQRTGIMEPETQLRAVYTALANIDSTLAIVLGEAQAARQVVEAARQSDQRASMIQSQAPLIAEIKGNLVELQMELARAQQVEGKTAAHPEVRRLLAQIEDARRSLAEELELEADALAVEQMVADTKVEALQQERQRLQQTMEKFPAGGVEYARLKADLDLLIEARAVLYKEREMAAIQEKASYQAFEILDPAVPPVEKSGPSGLLNAILAAFVAGLVTLLIVARQESARTSTPSEYENDVPN